MITGKNLITASTSKLFFLTLLLLIVINITEGETMNKVLITKDDNNKEITIKSGEIIWIELEVFGAAGYTWHIDKLDKEYLLVISKGTKDNSIGKVGAPVVKYWQIKAINKGVTRLRMLYFRPWEGAEKSAEKFEVKLNIK